MKSPDGIKGLTFVVDKGGLGNFGIIFISEKMDAIDALLDAGDEAPNKFGNWKSG
jgi:hypothetical protein